MRCGAPVDMALFPIPMRYAAYHLRPYAKKLGAFIHFFMCMHFGKERDNEKLKKREKKNCENADDREEKKIYIYIGKTYTYCISRMKWHGGARGKGPVRHPSIVHRSALCSYYENSHRNVGTTKTNGNKRHNNESDGSDQALAT